MSEQSQARAPRRAPETEISVDLSESDGSKAVQRRAKPESPADIASSVRDDQAGGRDGNYSPLERNMFRRMNRFQKNITKQFDQKLADQEARHQQELTALRSRYEGVSVERGGDTEAASAHERAMKGLEEKLAAANEKGDSAEAARLTMEIVKADGAYHAKLTGTKQRADTSGAAATPQTQRQAPATTGPTTYGSRFILANEDWWDDPDYVVEKGAASTLFIELTQHDGLEANSPELYREIAKRLKAKFPNLPVVNAKRRPDEDLGFDDPEDLDEPEGNTRDRDQPRRRAPAAAMQDRGESGQRRQRGGNDRRSLTPQELDTMKKVGLNPENDKDVIQFMREANAMEASA